MTGRIDAPKWDSIGVYKRCVNAFSRPPTHEKKSRLLGAMRTVDVRCQKYGPLAETGRLWRAMRGPPSAAQKHDFTSLYDDKFVKSKQGRQYYERALGNTLPGNRCPSCGHGQVLALDHFLPKAIYPAFALHPQNLVPICQPCNTMKKEYSPSSADTQLIHPYFDDVSNLRWLSARVPDMKSPLLIDFFVVEGLQSQLSSRLSINFRTLGLRGTYRTAASGELTDCKQLICNLYEGAGAPAVKAEMTERAASASSANRNSWRGAMYDALSASSWFCAGGFTAIA